MAHNDGSILPAPSPEHRRIAAGQFERANQVIATGNYDYGIQLLLTCCKLDPANLIYRQALRQTEKTKYKNNLRGSRLAVLSTSAGKAKLKNSKRSGDYLKVLEHGEDVLVRNPWDTGVQIDMAAAAQALGLLDLGVWILEQARQKNPLDPTVNRFLARLFEARGNFAQAMRLWDAVRKADPSDKEASQKANDLAAKETIARGHYAEGFGGRSQAKADDTAEAEEEEEGVGTELEPPTQIRTVTDRLAHDTAPLRAKIEADPTNANGYLHLASVFRRADQLDEACNVLEQGLGPTGNNFDLLMELADVEIEPFRQNLGITEEKLRTSPQDEDLRRLRIRLLKEINTRELDVFRQKADRYPNDQAHRFELGVRLLRSGQVDEAIVELQAARSDLRQRWRSLLYLGHCFKARHNWKLAQRNFEEALTALPANEEAAKKEILYQLAAGSAEAGELAQAIDHGLELANLDFAYRDIGRLLDEWQARLNSGPSPVNSES